MNLHTLTHLSTKAQPRYQEPYMDKQGSTAMDGAADRKSTINIIKFFDNHRILIRRSFAFGSIMFMLLFLVFIYAQKQEAVEGMRWSYLRTVYLPAIVYNLYDAIPNIATRNLASVAGAPVFSSSEGQAYSTTTVRSLPVLVYHGVVENLSDNDDGNNILVADFADHMKSLKEAGYKAISYEQFEQFTKGEISLPEKSVLITFDDGRKNSYYPVDPILQAYDYHATIFILPQYSIGTTSSYYLTESELHKMIDTGRWSIQSHGMRAHSLYSIDRDRTQGYFYTDKLWLADEGRIESDAEFQNRVFYDMRSSRSRLESKLGISVSSIAYPFGQYGQNGSNYQSARDVLSDVTQEVYSYAFYQVNPAIGFSYYDPERDGYMVRRIKPKFHWKGADLLAALDVGREKAIPFSDNFREFSGWLKLWGEYTMENSADLNSNSMTLGARASTTSSMVFLDGTYSWQDYKFLADVNLIKGKTFSLVARLKDGNNYTMCTFSEESIRMEQYVNGERTKLSEINDIYHFTGIDRNVGIGVYGNVVDCYLNGKIAIRGYDLDERLDRGGIGFKTWDEEINNSELVVKSVLVEK